MTDISNKENESDRFADWCRRICDSDDRALEELFRAMHEALVTYSDSMTRDRAVSRDLVQETFVKVWETRHLLDPQRSLRALLYKMVRNLALNHLRDQNNRDHLLNDRYADLPTPTTTPDLEMDGRWLRHHLNRFIDELPERQRESLRLSRFDGLTHSEISEAMGISPRTVNNHLVRALRHLRDRLTVLAPELLSEHS